MKHISNLAVLLRNFRLEIFKCHLRSFPDSALCSCPKTQFRYRQFSSFGRDELLSRPEVQNYLKFLDSEYEKHKDSESADVPILKVLKQLRKYEDDFKNLKIFSVYNDKELEKLIRVEEDEFRNKINDLRSELLTFAYPQNPDDGKGVTIQVYPGVGGQEAKLFSEELFDMYMKYAQFRNWDVDYLCKTCGEAGGVYKAEAIFSGKNLYKCLKHEAGVHRVQRVPVTEKNGKLQTSTCILNVLPNAEETDVVINEKDLKVEMKTSSGPGGQNVNKRETCVRITHVPTGIVVESQEERFQERNKNIALNKLRNILYNYQRDENVQKCKNLKKEQACSADRSMKVRTYNFQKNRITDHRINHTISNIQGYMEGGVVLDEMIQITQEELGLLHLIKNINRILEKKNADVLFRMSKHV